MKYFKKHKVMDNYTSSKNIEIISDIENEVSLEGILKINPSRLETIVFSVNHSC